MKSPRLLITCANANYSANYLQGIDTLSDETHYSVTVDTLDTSPIQQGLGQTVCLHFIANDNYTHQLNATLIAIEDLGIIGANSNQKGSIKRRYKLVLSTRLQLLKNTEHSRVFIDTSLHDILSAVLNDAGYHHAQIVFSTAQTSPQISQCVQAMETNLAFFNRLLQQYGLYYRFNSIGSDTGIIISDNNQSSPYLERGLLQVHHGVGFNAEVSSSDLIAYESAKGFVGFTQCQYSTRQTTGLASATSAEYQLQGENLAAHNFTQPVLANNTLAEHFAQNQSLALNRFEKVITLIGNVPDIFAGCSFSLNDASGLNASGDYLCISVEHYCQQPSDETSQDGLTKYHCVVTAIPRSTPFKLPYKAFAPLPTVFSAKVESVSAQPTLTASGEQHVKIGIDQTAKTPLTSTQPLRKLMHYVCANQPQATGWHFPLANDSQVLLGCVNNDPSQAFILGFDMNEDQPAVVNSQHYTYNRILSRAGHELRFDDDEKAPTLILHTLGSENYLALNANTQGEHYIKWLSQLGNISVHSAGSITLVNDEGDIKVSTAGYQHIDAKQGINIQANSENTGAIQLQSATQYQQTAKQLNLSSQGDVSLLTGGKLTTKANNTITWQSEQGNVSISAPQGSTLMNADGNIRIEGTGRGDITLFNQGGMIQLDSRGNVSLIGSDILTLNGSNITFDGDVTYKNSSPRTATNPSSPQPPNISRIADLGLTLAADLTSAEQTISLEYTYQDNEPVQQAPYVVKLSDGTEISGNLDSNGKAELTGMPSGQYTVQYGEDTRDYEPVDTTTPNPLYGKITPKAAIAMIETGDTSLLDDAANMAAGAGDWLWGTLQGDFNENPSTSQIVIGSVISMIPVVDQLMDCRDICANVMVLTDEEEDNDTNGWLALTLTSVGLVPIFGSAFKGVFKVVLANAGQSLDVALAVLRKLGKGDPEKYIRHIDWSQLTKDATKAAKEKVTIIKQALQTIVNSWAVKAIVDSSTLKAITKKIETLSAFEAKMEKGISDAMQTIKGKVNKAIDDYSGGKIRLGNTGNPLSIKTIEFKAPDYEIKHGVKAFSNSPVIFKRVHKNGQQEGKWPDSYTLINGKPLGAKAGVMPSSVKGLKTPPSNVNKKINQGWPDIAIKRTEFENFTDLKAVTLPKGTKIYRIIDEGTSEARFKSSGGYWALELPSSKEQWRSNYAVKDSWNDNGHYIEYTLEQETKVWQGGVAGQKYEEFNDDNFYLGGGGTQLYVEPGLIKNEQIQPKLTNWADAI